MKILRIFLLITIPLLHAAMMSFGLSHEQLMLPLALATLAVTDIALSFFFSRDHVRAQVFSHSFPSLALLLFSFAILYFIQHNVLIFSVIVINSVLQYIFIVSLYRELHTLRAAADRSLQHISFTTNTLALFYASSIFFGLRYLLDVPFWQMIVPFTLVVMLFNLQEYFIQEVSVKEHRMIILVYLVLAIELARALLWLPSGMYVNALVYTASLHVFSLLSFSVIRRETWRYQYVGYSLLAFVVVVLGCMTAIWR